MGPLTREHVLYTWWILHFIFIHAKIPMHGGYRPLLEDIKSNPGLDYLSNEVAECSALSLSNVSGTHTCRPNISIFQFPNELTSVHILSTIEDILLEALVGESISVW